MQQFPLKTFICYAHEDRKTVEAVLKHLRPLEKKQHLELWDDGQILPGQDWDKSIKRRLEAAHLVLLFVSVDFLNSDYIEKTELKAALERHHAGEAHIVPVIVRACDWADYFEIGRFQALPNQARPIMSKHFPYSDDAYFEISQGIKALAIEWQQKMAAQETARQQAETEKAEAAAAAKAEKTRLERLQKADDTAWKTACAAAEAAQELQEKMHAYDAYLDDEQHQRHRSEAEKRHAELVAEQTRRRIEAKKQAEAKRQAEEEAQARAAQAAHKKNGYIHRDAFLDGTGHAPEMVFVEGGTFLMGDDNGKDNEKPAHKTRVSDFWIGRCPLTVADFQAFAESENYRSDAEKEGSSYIWNPGKLEYQKTEGVYWRHDGNGKPYQADAMRRPVIHVSWNDAVAYCQWLSRKTGQRYNLPTEAEWEFAARGGTLTKGFQFPGSDKVDEVAWHSENSNSRTHIVGGKKPNELGLYDMAGNVWEWCRDWFDEKYYEQFRGSLAENPKGPDSGASRVLRGGSWVDGPFNCRTAYRGWNYPTIRYDSFGFRLARVAGGG